MGATMNVMLVNPRRPSAYETADIIIPPMGLLYLASTLQKNGHSVELKDQVTADTRLDFTGADVVGITCYAPTYNLALQIAFQAHQSGLPVVVGGPQVTFLVPETLQTNRVDYVVLGEAEKTMSELLDCLAQENTRCNLSKIPGLAYRENGFVRVTPPRRAIPDLDALPFPARELIDWKTYRHTTLDGQITAPIVTSRGCPYRCSFCVVPNLPQRKWRARSVENILQEIEQVLTQYGIGAFVFTDDNFTIDVNRIKDLCKKITERDLQINWWCMSRADTLIKNPDMVEMMAAAGCSTIFMGLESASEKVLKTYNKKEEVEAGFRAVEMLEKHNICPYASFILGSVNETEQEIEKTIDYAVRLNPHVAQFSILTPYPGTKIYRELQPRFITRNWDLFDGIHAVFQPEQLTAPELEKLLVKAYRKFYLRPRRLWNFLKSYQVKSAIQVIRFLKNNNKKRRPQNGVSETFGSIY